MDEAYVLLVITQNQVQLWPFVTQKAADEAAEFLTEAAPGAQWKIISDRMSDHDD